MDIPEALRAVRTTWDQEVRDGAAACGLEVAGSGYESMRTAWLAELGVVIAVLEQP